MIEYATHTTPVSLRESASNVSRNTGKSLTAQFREFWRIKRALGALTAREYYYFGLCDDTLFSREEKIRFIGADIQKDRVAMHRQTIHALGASDPDLILRPHGIGRLLAWGRRRCARLHGGLPRVAPRQMSLG